MICFPNAKINLGLHIISKRPDGYHNIETVFYPVALRDALEIVPAHGEKGTFRQTGIPVDGHPEDNLVMKALKLLSSTYKIPEIDICLLKKIPFGAGLGGGSSNAAFMLKLLNDYAQLGLTNNELEGLAGQLGADCPFFIRNKAVFASGIGNIFENIEISLEDYRIVLVKPDVQVSTKAAYSMVRPAPAGCSLKRIAQSPVETWKEHMVNDFEQSVFRQYPSLRNIKEQLYGAGAVYASMSGSGSSLFGIFKGEIPRFPEEYFGAATIYPCADLPASR
ncbi:MAG: 4-(cytidine 5'-diphospho)-2-C-methyl-D-erythritol kinase [Dysgonamonadaceae bacterium]|jgi:4-diphosphocytidyl-2-C-methyl-D-erythritol kinase|nr:4-(cytidine 5'-diphospho)-2-C-methyl-D-erythritol kinase [Dysgonamonadaceae bacterium]